MELYRVVCCVLATLVRAQNWSDVVETLGNGIGASTNIFYAFEIGPLTERFLDVITETSLPKLVMTTAMDYELRHNYISNVLSIVIMENELEYSVRKTLKKTLNRWHKTDMIFLTTMSVSDTREWVWLFEWCWQNGFYNVLLADAEAGIFSLDPFPQLQVQSTSVQEYLKQRNNWLDFKGYEIHVALGHDPPRALVYFNEYDELITSGYMPNIIKLFLSHYNATLSPLLLPNFEHMSLYDCLESLALRTTDICADGAPLMDSFLISRPQYKLFGYLLVPFAQPIAKFRYFLVPFHGYVWMWIGASICYITLITSLIYWKQQGNWNVGKFFLEAISSVLYLSFNLNLLRGKLRYFIFTVLLITGFMLANLYLAVLSSILTTNVFDRQINNLEDLRTHNVTVVVSDYDMQLFDSYGISPIIRERLVDLDIDEQLKFHDSLDPRYSYFNFEDKGDFFLYQQKFMIRPRMKLLEQSVLALWGNMPIRNDWPFEEMFNDYLSRIYDAGLYMRFLENTKEEGIRNRHIHFFKTEYYEAIPLSIEYFEMPAILLTVGYVAAFSIFFVEKLRGWKK